MRYTQDAEDLRPAGVKKVDVDWDAAVKYAEKLQNKNEDDPTNYGGFSYSERGARGGTSVDKKTGQVRLAGFGSMTYAGLETMIYAQVDRTDPKVRSALEWAARHWSVDKNPGMGTKGLFYYYNVMGKALSISGVDSLEQPDGNGQIDWREQVIEKLASTQQSDGSWVNRDNHFWEGDASLVTAYAILTLEYITGR
jgi:squalene-hopene/tetraprenyl-beta-curcumene cyclase